MTDEPTDAQRLNTDEPGNPSGKPVQDGTDLEHGDDRTQVDEADRDAVWADAEVLDHTPDVPGPYAP